MEQQWQPVEDMAELLKLALPVKRDYHTTAGFALVRLGRFPTLGDAFEFAGCRFEVVDIDGRPHRQGARPAATQADIRCC